MKKSELTFAEGVLGLRSKNGDPQKVFDWDKAAEEIKKFIHKDDLIVEAGLQGDWDYTGGVIFENGKPRSDSNTYLSSNWADPTLIISFDGQEQLEIPCFTTDENSRFGFDSKWDDISKSILGTTS